MPGFGWGRLPMLSSVLEPCATRRHRDRGRQAISQRLAQEGCNVVIADVNETGVNETATAIGKETGRRVLGVKVDVTQEADVNALFERAVKEFGRVDIVVANAAILIAEPIADADAEKWRAVMNVNLFGYFLTTKYACRVMKKQKGGSIININSKSGKKGSAANSAYAATKFGCVGHTQSVALEMARPGKILFTLIREESITWLTDSLRELTLLKT